MENEITTVAPTHEMTPAMMMMAAIEKGLDLDKVARAMDLQERYEANQARKAFHDAMAGFKANPPEIEKDRHVEYKKKDGTVTSYNHASLANVTQKINSSLSAHGLSAAWKVSQSDKQITVTCTITHRLGHYESTSLSASPDDSGGKNAIQSIGSTISYLERYTLLALTGLATHEMDDDSTSTGDGPEYITEAQAAVLKKLLEETNSDTTKFLKHIAGDAGFVEKILASNYDKSLIALQEKRKRIEDKKTTRQPGDDDK